MNNFLKRFVPDVNDPMIQKYAPNIPVQGIPANPYAGSSYRMGNGTVEDGMYLVADPARANVAPTASTQNIQTKQGLYAVPTAGSYSSKPKLSSTSIPQSTQAQASQVQQPAPMIAGDVDANKIQKAMIEVSNLTSPNVAQASQGQKPIVQEIPVAQPEDPYAMRSRLQVERNRVAAGLTPDGTRVQTITDSKGNVIPFEPGDRERVTKSMTKQYDQDIGSLDKQINTLESGSGNSELTKKQITSSLQALNTSFKNEPIVENFQTIQEGYNYVYSLDGKTENPMDDYGLVMALTKTFDPRSATLLSEFDAAKKNSDSFVSMFGSSVNQVINGTGSLSEDARKNIKQSIKNRYEANKKSFINLQKEYKSNAERIKNNDFIDITDYSFEKEDNKSDKGLIKINNIDDMLAVTASRESAGSKDIAGGDNPYYVVSFHKDSNGNIKNTTQDDLKNMSRQQIENLAYGKYQIQGKNIPDWSKEITGKSINIDQFLRNPELQEQIARGKMEQFYKKHGNWEDVGSVWFTGKPVIAGYNPSDGGTDRNSYIKKGVTPTKSGGSYDDYLKAIQ